MSEVSNIFRGKIEYDQFPLIVDPDRWSTSVEIVLYRGERVAVCNLETYAELLKKRDKNVFSR